MIAYPQEAAARITRVVVSARVAPAFGGRVFGDAGQYEVIYGRAYGELDPGNGLNAVIQDIDLAPRNAGGAVEYDMDVAILRPMDSSKSNGVLLYEPVNRGRKFLRGEFDLGAPNAWPDPTVLPGDGFLENHGYILAWSGWQGDLIPGYQGNMTIRVPVATDNGAVITGAVPVEMTDLAGRSFFLSSSFWNGVAHAPYESVTTDNSAATLTVRTDQLGPRTTVSRSDWAFADCTTTPFPGVPNPKMLCLRNAFDNKLIYELVYTAKNPPILGIGLAATRDFVSFLRKDPVAEDGTRLSGRVAAAISYGLSQSGRFVRTFVHLGFNEDEDGRKVFDGITADIAAGQLPLNARWAQPGRAYGEFEDNLYPGYESTFTWKETQDKVIRSKGGILDRCKDRKVCPTVMQTVTSSEFWQGHMSLNLTDPLARFEVDVPKEVRVYAFAGTQHVPTRAAPSTLGMCQQLNNPNPYVHMQRALLIAHTRWILEGVEPPASATPSLRHGTLVAPEDLAWPVIPGVRYAGLVNRLPVLDFGPAFDGSDESGILGIPAVQQTKYEYKMLVPAVDEDGNEVAGIRSTALQAPTATYTGWNLRLASYGDHLCPLTVGSYIPFARTAAERALKGDPRLSLEERYGDHEGYVQAVAAAAADLVGQGFLLPEDATLLVSQAAASSVLR